ncbi:MarR family winged helix-turn-helix transcriptional regulator [Sphingopyxis sp.]|uniref:MarR family winged helix-turn-helix transcriptional regulator n=1 Tax=Sphingopyxis sp. TaxID=1908224 RepID=UPI003D6CF003
MSVSDQRIFHLLQLAAHRLKVLADREGLAAGGVTGAQAGALFAISARAGMTQRELGEALQINESAVTGTVNRLLDAGLVSKSVDAVDGRSRRLAMTAKGEAALASTRAPLDRINRLIAEAVGSEDVPGLARMLRSIANLPPDHG